MAIADQILSEPAGVAVVVTILGAIAWATREYVGPDDDWIYALRRYLLPVFDGPSREYFGRPLVREKGSEAEYVVSTNTTLDGLDEAMLSYGYEPNFPSTLKYIVVDGERLYESRSYRYVPPENEAEQHHAYVFDFGDGQDIHQHVEVAWDADPEGHVDDARTRGDPDGHLRGALTAGGVGFR